MTIEKPSKNEEEYFALLDQELLRKQRELAQAAREAAERRSHFMKCPKDGYDLTSQEFHGVQIEHCGHCGGIWLDAGELEAIRQHEDHTGLLGRIVNDVLVTLGGDRRRSKRG
jgi:TFIIB-like protein